MTTQPLHLTIQDNTDDRLDLALSKLLPDYSRSQLKTWIDAGNVLLNGKPAKGKTKVKFGDQIEVTAIAKPALTYEAENIPLNIVHEDDDVLIINKPAGLVVHPGAGNQTHTLLNALLHHAPNLKHLPRAGILHRLDKDTTGLLVIAKNETALKSLSKQLKDKSMQREYQTIVSGTLVSGGTVDAPIDRHHLQRTRMAVTDTGKTAVTHYRILQKFRAHTHLKLMLETGRTHQIRVHMAHIRHPIIGDPTYGGRMQLMKNTTPELTEALRTIKRQALHAFALGFVHPGTHEDVRYEIALPEDMQTLLKQLKDDTEKNSA
jgi:23S rRNA pseudouridine1911/1915/1917 synthase